MHDLDHGYGDHDHDDFDEANFAEENQALQDFIYLHDNVELTTIGVDVGSSTFHLMFAKVHLQRETHDHSSRFEVVHREVLWRSEIGLTPYSGKRIDTDAVRTFVADSHTKAGLRRE